ncbi:MAG: peptidoglycan-N-acetylglucosamine deacetylase [Chloroflexota bacterium]|nr:peptidoglycan-N-acetylglucosamine deacetylase [Chloroflexota bacterium]
MTARLTVCLSCDVDSMAVWPTAFGITSPMAMSRGEIEGEVAIPRVLDLLRKHQIPGTFFVPVFTMMAFPDPILRMRDEGHEIGFHGWMHEAPADFDRDGLQEVMDKGFAGHREITGLRPTGYRTPGADITPTMIDALLDNGFLYEATLSAGDFQPWYIRRGDQFVLGEPFRFGTPSELVAMPFSWALNDFQQVEFVGGWSTTMKTAEQLREIWQAEFDFAYDHAQGGVFTICMHPQAIGRGSRIAMLDDFITYMKSKDGVVFSRIGDYASQWKRANPLEEWVPQHPELTGGWAFDEGVVNQGT